MMARIHRKSNFSSILLVTGSKLMGLEELGGFGFKRSWDHNYFGKFLECEKISGSKFRLVDVDEVKHAFLMKIF